jgi:hypothetical protein
VTSIDHQRLAKEYSRRRHFCSRRAAPATCSICLWFVWRSIPIVSFSRRRCSAGQPILPPCTLYFVRQIKDQQNYKTEMLPTERPTRRPFYRTGGRAGPHLQGKRQTWAPLALSRRPFTHARTHGEHSPPREGKTAAPPLPTAGGQASHAGCATAPSRLPPDAAAAAPHCERREGASLPAAGVCALASRGRRTSKHIAGAPPLLQSLG